MNGRAFLEAHLASRAGRREGNGVLTELLKHISVQADEDEATPLHHVPAACTPPLSQEDAPRGPRPGGGVLQDCRAAPPPAPRVLATFCCADELVVGHALSRGAARVWGVLHRLAVDTARARAYTVTPDQVTFHCPAVTVAGVLNYTDRHLRTLANELAAAGLIEYGGHAQTVAGRNLYDGTLWAVTTRPGATARVRIEEWRHMWRPTFQLDYEGKTGAMKEISELQTQQGNEEERYEVARRRAAVPGVVLNPAMPSSEIVLTQGLRAVVEQLPAVWQVHVRHRAREVGKLASAIAGALSEPERRRYWCRVLWDALRSEQEDRGGVQVLGAQLARLAGDLDEGAPWRNAGAVLAARLRGA